MQATKERETQKKIYGQGAAGTRVSCFQIDLNLEKVGGLWGLNGGVGLEQAGHSCNKTLIFSSSYPFSKD